MPNVIDTLNVALNLEADKFVEGQKKARDALKATRDEATKHAKELSSEIGEKLSNAFSKATLRVIEFLAALAGARGMESFVTQTVSAGNAMNLMATAIGMNIHRLSEFENAVQKSGGTADAAAGSLKRLNDVRLAVRDESAPMPFWMARLGVNLSGTKNGEDVLKQLVDRAKSQGRSESDFVYETGTMGVDAATAEWAYKQGSSKGIDSAISAQSATAWTEDQVKAATRLRSAWVDASLAVTALARNIFTDVEPALTGLLKWVNEIVAKSGPSLQGWIGDKIKDVAAAIQNVDWKSIGVSLDGYLDKVQKIVTALGGWEKAGVTFLELWAGYKIAQVIGTVNQLAGALGGLSKSSLLLGSSKLGIALGIYQALQTPEDPKTLAENLEKQRQYDVSHDVSAPIRDFLWGFVTGTNPAKDRMFQNMRGRSIGDVSENNPLPVKIVGGLTGSSAPSGAGLPDQPYTAPSTDSGGGASGGGMWNNFKSWLGFGGGSGGVMPTSGNKADLAAGLKAAYPHLTTGQCVELAQVMNGVGNVHDWRQGANVMQNRPPVGTAVATFGWNGDSKLYAYGGNGTPGAGRDHAGIVAGYDATGVTLLNQWGGQSPTYTHYDWKGMGERGGQNYYVINDPNNHPAGKNADLLNPPKKFPHINWGGARVNAHSAEHERLSMMGRGSTSVQIGAVTFGGAAGRSPSNSLDEKMARNLFISRADYGLA